MVLNTHRWHKQHTRMSVNNNSLSTSTASYIIRHNIIVMWHIQRLKVSQDQCLTLTHWTHQYHHSEAALTVSSCFAVYCRYRYILIQWLPESATITWLSSLMVRPWGPYSGSALVLMKERKEPRQSNTCKHTHTGYSEWMNRIIYRSCFSVYYGYYTIH